MRLYDLSLAKTQVWAHFHLGMVVVVMFFFQKVAAGPRTDSTWTRDRAQPGLNLGQGRGPTWGPGLMGLILDQGRISMWTRDGAHTGPGVGHLGPGMAHGGFVKPV